MDWMVENGDPRMVLLLTVQASNKISIELHPRKRQVTGYGRVPIPQTRFAPDRFTTIFPVMEMAKASKASTFQGNNGFKPIARSGQARFIGPRAGDEGLKV
jgi:hypothetical protein